MSFENIFSAAQIMGYITFIFGVSAFSQKNDRKLKLLSALQCACGTLHFFLLGNYAASMTMFISMLRSMVAVYTRSPWVAAIFAVLCITLGSWVAQSWLSFIPITGSVVAVLGIFLLKGEKMRYTLMLASALWLVNNIISGSLGGTLQEIVMIAMGGLTIYRIRHAQKYQR